MVTMLITGFKPKGSLKRCAVGNQLQFNADAMANRPTREL